MRRREKFIGQQKEGLGSSDAFVCQRDSSEEKLREVDSGLGEVEGGAISGSPIAGGGAGGVVGGWGFGGAEKSRGERGRGLGGCKNGGGATAGVL